MAAAQLAGASGVEFDEGNEERKPAASFVTPRMNMRL
jgi:hypothetical protein